MSAGMAETSFHLLAEVLTFLGSNLGHQHGERIIYGTVLNGRWPGNRYWC